MYRIASTILVSGIFFLSGCANFNSVHRLNKLKSGGQTEFIDAKQRAVIAVPVSNAKADEPMFRICAEPAPDVFSIFALATAAQGNLEVSPKDEANGSANLSLSAAENGATIERTQTINLMRESMYRTCERFLSGAISSTEMQTQAARDQRAMVAILAIEQLTGVVKRQPTILSTQAQTVLLTTNEMLIKQRLEESEDLSVKQSSLDDAAATLEASKSAYATLHNGSCDAIINAPPLVADTETNTQSDVQTTIATSTELDGSVETVETTSPVETAQSGEAKAAAEQMAQKSECLGVKKVLSDAEANFNSKKSARDAAKSKLADTTELLKQLGSTLLSASAGGRGTGDDGSDPSLKEIQAVASAVEKIAQAATSPQSEMVYVCSRVVEQLLDFKEPNDSQKGILSACSNILNTQNDFLKSLTN